MKSLLISLGISVAAVSGIVVGAAQKPKPVTLIVIQTVTPSPAPTLSPTPSLTPASILPQSSPAQTAVTRVVAPKTTIIPVAAITAPTPAPAASRVVIVNSVRKPGCVYPDLFRGVEYTITYSDGSEDVRRYDYEGCITN